MSLPPISPRQNLMLSPTQYRLLERWAAGDFEADFDRERPPPNPSIRSLLRIARTCSIVPRSALASPTLSIPAAK